MPVLIGIRCYHGILTSSSLSETKYLFIHLYGLFKFTSSWIQCSCAPVVCHHSVRLFVDFVGYGCCIGIVSVCNLSALCLCFFVVLEGSSQQCLSRRLQFLFVIPSFVIRVVQSLSEGLSGTALFCSLGSFVWADLFLECLVKLSCNTTWA